MTLDALFNAEPEQISSTEFFQRDWSPEDIETLRGMTGRGYSYQKIAAKLRRSIGGVRCKANDIGISAYRHTPWTDARIAMLQKMVEEKRSASAIGAILGISRNAVLGKAFRLGLSVKSQPKGHIEKKPRRMTARGPKNGPSIRKPRLDVILIPKEEAELPPDFSPHKVSLPDIGRHQCRWPIGDPVDPEFGFCGADKCEGYSYCARHCRIAYVVKHDRTESSVPGFRQCVVLQPQGRSCADEGIRGLAEAGGLGARHPEAGADQGAGQHRLYVPGRPKARPRQRDQMSE